MALPDQVASFADATASGHAEAAAQPPAPYVLPFPSAGYAQRSTLRTRLFAFAITVALHGAALIGIMLYRSPGVFVAPPPEPLVVTLLPLARPPAEVKKHHEKAKIVPTPPRPALVTPIVRPIVPNMVSPIVATPDETPPASVSPPALQATPAAPAISAPFSDSAGNAQDSWEGRVLARLERFKRFPPAALSRRDQGVATIRFRLDRQGHVSTSSIARSSGSRILDAEALATLARADPLPAIPPNRPDQIELLVPIEFFLLAGR
ncbi:energy transducer TonB family protein [Sphingomonas gei]|uniref:energy transducer TonB family protein n=1 Tax=Sphingomonas gei TaxID=1395960 RepID=UPI001441D34C|nr:energy transducer TonB [Sphingomonas gei]